MSIQYYDWEVVRKIGSGSFGTVYEIQRRSFHTVYKAALKVITIPHSENELESVRSSGMDDASITEYFESVAAEIVREFDLMSQLKGTTNIVSYEDHLVQRHSDSVGWDIMIRMELLTSLNRYLSDHTIRPEEVIRLGIDLCKALERCQKCGIIHRDIKPDNIFVSPQGDFKLGDFGIARTAERTMSGMSRKGTFSFMAPEVYMGRAYGPSVDLYSLGLVMYRLLNNNRAPFLPPYPETIKYRDQEQALARRMSGEALPPPSEADEALAEIVLKACAYRSGDRYSSPTQMREELEALLPHNDRKPSPVMAAAPMASVEPAAPMEMEEDTGTVKLFGDTEYTPWNGSLGSATTETIPQPSAAEPEAESTMKLPPQNNPSSQWTDPPKPEKKGSRIPLIAILVLIALALLLLLMPSCKSQSAAAPENSTQQAAETDWQAAFERALAAWKAQNYDEAIDEFETCLEGNPDYVDAYGSLATMYLEMDDMPMAIETLERGASQTGDPELIQRLEELETLSEPDSEPEEEEEEPIEEAPPEDTHEMITFSGTVTTDSLGTDGLLYKYDRTGAGSYLVNETWIAIELDEPLTAVVEDTGEEVTVTALIPMDAPVYDHVGEHLTFTGYLESVEGHYGQGEWVDDHLFGPTHTNDAGDWYQIYYGGHHIVHIESFE